jgi:hypothetical protein
MMWYTMNRMFFKNTPMQMQLGIGLGALLSVVSGLVYFVVLREPGPAFYPFAGLAFLAGPLAGGIVAALKTREHRPKAFLVSGVAVFGMVSGLFLLMYMVLPQFARANVRLPAFCDGLDGSFDPPAHLAYSLPGPGVLITGLLITGDARSAVVAVIDASAPPFASTVFLVNRSNNEIIQGMRFDNDTISAAMDQGTAYIFNDKLGYLIDTRTGQLEQNFLIMDNYGGLTETDRPVISRASSGHWYMETAAVISSWNVDGTVKSRPHLTFNGIARGCFISGDTHDVTQLE